MYPNRPMLRRKMPWEPFTGTMRSDLDRSKRMFPHPKPAERPIATAPIAARGIASMPPPGMLRAHPARSLPERTRRHASRFSGAHP
jgi:hypothetical protein